MPRDATQEINFPIHDLSGGIISGISERGLRKVNWLSAADNYYGRPFRGIRVRPGTRDLSSDILSDQPHSLMAFYSGGGNQLFVGAANKIFDVGSGAYTLQTLPGSHPSSSDIFTHTNLDGILVATQRGGALTPLQYDGAWEELKLPVPVAAIGFAADTAGGNVDAGTHYYRIRWRFAHGSSLAGPVSAAHVVAGPNNTVNINAGLAASARADYIGWTLERTKVNGTALGPFWFVADGTGTGPYADTTADASLGYLVDEGLHGEPLHFDGLTNFTNRIFGWAGSLLYASQKAYGDLEATGIANFDFDNVYPVSKDDGDDIMVCVQVIDELLVLKRRSVHVLSGVDIDSYVLTPVVSADPSRGSEAGCAGPRAACVVGGVAYFWGEGGLFTYSRGRVTPVAWLEMGSYIDQVNDASLDNLLLINHQGNYMLAWYPSGAESNASHQIVRDVRLQGKWWHWKGWTARDAIEIKSGILGGASMAYCDPRNRSFFPALAGGESVTGAGIPALTTVLGPVDDGATSLTLSANATATAQDVTLTINGVVTPHCNTTIGSPTVTISSYHCWSAFDGFMDEKDSLGAGGTPPETMFEPPWLDWGLPDEWKDMDRLSFSAEGDQSPVTIAVKSDPGGAVTALSLTTTISGSSWAPPIGSGTDDLDWDIDNWAGEEPSTVAAGVPMGTIGRRFKITVSSSPTGDFRPSGLEIIAVLLPDKEYDI